MAEVNSYVTINDFTPGIITRSEYALGGVGLPAPLGSAQQTNTYRCIALPSGGLAPLPKRNVTLNVPAPEASMANVIAGYALTGFAHMGAVGGTQDNLFMSVEYIFNNAGNPQRRHRVYRLRDIVGSGYSFDTVKSINSAQVNPVHTYNSVFFFTTRVAPVDPTLPGIPVVVFGWQAYGGGSEQYIDAWPDPAAPNANGVYEFTTVRYGHIFGHQARVVLLEFVQYSFGNAGELVITNEQVSFTDPPNSETLGSQAEVFVQEVPTGFGAWGSVSAGELFLVKRQGGGVVVSGDIANPTITYLPGVTPTGLFTQKALSTKSGLIYATEEMGLHVWAGGNSSEKISEKLDNSFLLHPNAPSGEQSRQAVFSNWGGDWVVCTNNWLLNQANGSWWQLEDQSLFNGYHWQQSFTAPILYGVLPVYNNNSLGAIAIWDRRVPSSSFNWRGHPIPKSINRLIDIREVTCLIEGDGVVVITLIDLAGNSSNVSFTASSVTQPQLFCDNISLKGYSVIVDIASTATATGPAPVVHMVSLGVYESQQAIRTT